MDAMDAADGDSKGSPSTTNNNGDIQGNSLSPLRRRKGNSFDTPSAINEMLPSSEAFLKSGLGEFVEEAPIPVSKPKATSSLFRNISPEREPPPPLPELPPSLTCPVTGVSSVDGKTPGPIPPLVPEPGDVLDRGGSGSSMGSNQKSWAEGSSLNGAGDSNGSIARWTRADDPSKSSPRDSLFKHGGSGRNLNGGLQPQGQLSTLHGLGSIGSSMSVVNSNGSKNSHPDKQAMGGPYVQSRVGKQSHGGSRQSNASGTSTAFRHRRVRKGGTFSAYEASNYEPIIRKSWELLKIRAASQNQGLGCLLYRSLFTKNPDIHHMFTSAEEEMGVKFEKVLEDIVAAVEDPVAINKRLKALAPMHLKVGVKPEHTDRMGSALYVTLDQVLGDAYTAEVKAAWEWLWAWLSMVMAQSLEDATNEATVLTYSWDIALDNLSEEELGALFYDTLFDLAPNLKPVFNKPRQILSSKFIEMMSTMVSFHGDPMRMEEQITWLGFRHIKYGAKPEHSKVLGDVLVETMARAVEEDWTMDMADAWHELWHKACDEMMSVIKDATQYGSAVQCMWTKVRSRSTEATFGSTLRKLLLSGTEWVSHLSHGILEGDDPKKDKKQKEKEKEKEKEMQKETKGFMIRLHDTAKSPGPARRASALSFLQGTASPPNKENGGLASADQSRRPSSADTPAPATRPTQLQQGTTFKNMLQRDDLLEDNSSESDAIGRYFWVMMTELLVLLWEPEKQNERLIVMTTRLHGWGIRTKHLPTIGEAIGEACRRVLKNDWSSIMQDGWTWWWGVTSKQMAKTLYVCEQDHARIITQSWELCKERSSTLQLGELFFKELNRMAPHIMFLFKRPKIIQAAQFVAVVDALVAFVEEPEAFFEGFKALTIRHIKYGVKAEYAKAFGKSILFGIETTLAEAFDDETREVWQMLWMRASSCVARALNVGTNPVVVSLVQGDVDKMRDSINCSERGLRFEWLTNVDINGESISPIYWSLKDGNIAMVKFLVADLLTIRADREMYYYGREVLFDRHPDIVLKLCQECPDVLIDTLLQGLMWHSKEVEDGQLRVNYYIQDLYCDPDKEPDVWKQTLAVLVTEGHPRMFAHPVARKLLEVKWKRFGRNYFLIVQSVYVLILTLFMIGHVEHRHECSYQPIRYVTGSFSVLFTCAQAAVCFRHFKNGWIANNEILFNAPVPSWIADTSNVMRLLSLFLISISSFVDCCDCTEDWLEGTHNGKYVVCMGMNSVAGIILWGVLMQSLVLSTRLASLTYTLGLFGREILRNLVVVLVFVCSFGTALTALKQEHCSTFLLAIIHLARFVLGVDHQAISFVDPLGLLFLFGFIIVVVVGMFNILIAQMLGSVAQVAEATVGFAMQHQASICIHMESIMPMSWRKEIYGEMKFDESVTFDSGHAGPSGAIQEMEPASIRNSAYYFPDRVLRFTGDTSPKDPWPTTNLEDSSAQETARIAGKTSSPAL